MTTWIDYATGIGALVGGLGLAGLTKAYYDRVIAGKDNELKRIATEVDSLKSDLSKAETKIREVAETPPAHRDLARLREQLSDAIERLAKQFRAQAASLYVPVFNAGDETSAAPRSFAFVAAYNNDQRATAAILKLKLVDAWTVVGESWEKGLISKNDLQGDVRHVASYDKETGFVPMQTLVAPIHWQSRKIGVIQFFNKTRDDGSLALDEQGFTSDDRRALQGILQETSSAGVPSCLHQFQSDPESLRVLGLQDELSLENAVVMCVDLTRSSTLFNELPLIDASRLINRFSETVYQQMRPYAGIVERSIGDGTLVHFHFDGFDSRQPMTHPVLRAVCAAADLTAGFEQFKADRWQALARDVCSGVRIRITLALGPIVSMNMGPRQIQVPTVMGPCVNRAAKMNTLAPRDRDVLIVDDNLNKALKQIDAAYASATNPFDAWLASGSVGRSPLSGYRYYEVATAPFAGLIERFRLAPYWRST